MPYPPPHGDTQEHPSVLQAAERWTRAATQLESYPRPHPETDAAPQVDAHDDELLDLARTLQTPVPEVPAELIDRETWHGAPPSRHTRVRRWR